MFQVPSTSGGAGGSRKEGGVEGVDGSVNQRRCDPWTIAPRSDHGSPQPVCRSHSVETLAPSPEVCAHIRIYETPASPSDLDDGDSAMGDEVVAASLL